VRDPPPWAETSDSITSVVQYGIAETAADDTKRWCGSLLTMHRSSRRAERFRRGVARVDPTPRAEAPIAAAHDIDVYQTPWGSPIVAHVDDGDVLDRSDDGFVRIRLTSGRGRCTRSDGP
jgi:hypothetical protein